MTEQEPLKLEVGKAYRTRDGRGPVRITTKDYLGFCVGELNGLPACWQEDGRNCIEDQPCDLIAEWGASDADGWIQWSGGECPVPPQTMVETRLRCGQGWEFRAAGWIWEHGNSHGDIIAYRIVKPAASAPKQEPKPGTVTKVNLKATPLEGVGKNPTPEPDYKDIAHEMAAQLGMAIIRLRANPDWLGVLVNRETGERYSWEESFARSIERLPDMKVDRRYLEAKQLPAKQRRARYAELEAEKRAKEPPCPIS